MKRTVLASDGRPITVTDIPYGLDERAAVALWCSDAGHGPGRGKGRHHHHRLWLCFEL